MKIVIDDDEAWMWWYSTKVSDVRYLTTVEITEEEFAKLEAAYKAWEEMQDFLGKKINDAQALKTESKRS